MADWQPGLVRLCAGQVRLVDIDVGRVVNGLIGRGTDNDDDAPSDDVEKEEWIGRRPSS